MDDNFGSALARVLVYEGGKVDHPKDPGGRTNQGITQRVYPAYRQRRGLKSRDVFLMEPTERDSIYKAQYWDAIKGDQLPAGLDLVMFDSAAHSGAAQAIKWLQRALGVSADGQIGQLTLRAIENTSDVDRLVAGICSRRLLFCQALKTWGTFGNGWKSRISNLQLAGQAMAAGSVGPTPIYASGSDRKALLTDAKAAPQTILADASAGGGFSASATIAWVREQTTQFMGVSEFTDRILGIVMAVAALVAIGAGVYALYARKRAAVLADRLDTVPMQLAASPVVTDTTDVQPV